MKSVLKDSYWLEAANFVKSCQVSRLEIIGPHGFDLLAPCKKYDDPYGARLPKVFVLHKGQIDDIDATVLNAVIHNLSASFANEVFVVFTEDNRRVLRQDHVHLRSIELKLRKLMHGDSGSGAGTGRAAVYLGNNTALTRTIYGQKMFLDTRDLSLAPHILLDGYWEQWITNVFRQLVKPGMTVIDIGANVGWYSLIAAELVGESGRLVSFEANPHLADILFRNLVINGFHSRSKVEPVAVYSETTELEFHVFDRFMGANSLYASHELAAQFNDTLKTLRVPATSLNDYFASGSRVDLIKIDAEGAEPFILKGAERVLRDNAHLQIMMEFAPLIFASSFGSVANFWDLVRSLGFSIFRIREDSALIACSEDQLSTIEHCDILLRR